jgi:hypothetical protein
MICPYLKSCQMLQNGIPGVYLYFCSTERNSESFSLLLKDSEQNPESLLLFLLCRTEFRAFFSSAEFQESASIFVPLYRVPSIFFFHEMVWNRIPRDFCSTEQPDSAGANQNCFVYSVFRGIIFLSEISNPTYNTEIYLRLLLAGPRILVNFFMAHFYSKLRFPLRAF